MGQTAYFGPAVKSLKHFRRLGHKPAGLVNPADYLLEITNSDFSDAGAIQRLVEAWGASAACDVLDKRLAAPISPPVAAKRKTGCMDAVRQLGKLVSRSAVSSIRDPSAYALRYL
ncbi:unnamed protein product, partial [Hapterophycus canaliculatus]